MYIYPSISYHVRNNNTFATYDKLKGTSMPINKVSGGYKYGTTGKLYPTKKQAEAQASAIKISQSKESKKPKK